MNTETRYSLDTPLTAGNYISITLAWDRLVDFDNDGGTTDQFDVGDTFETYPTGSLEDQVSDLGIFLVQSGQSFDQALAGAFSDGIVEFGTGYNLEHLFYEVPTTGMYDIVIPHFIDTKPFPLPPQDYALAWWHGLAPDIGGPNPNPDFDGDGDVDGADLSQWQGDYAVNADSDADGDSDSDGSDFLAWQREFTGAGSVAEATSIPEPSCAVLLLFGLLSPTNTRKPKSR